MRWDYPLLDINPVFIMGNNGYKLSNNYPVVIAIIIIIIIIITIIIIIIIIS